MSCRILHSLTALLSPLALAACSGLGSAPPELVELYDMAATEGTIEMELDRDGTIVGIEGDVPIEALPPKMREKALEMLPGARITGAEREFMHDGNGWEVKLTHEERAWEIVLDDDGNVIETEKELRAEEVPPEVLASADKALPRGQRTSVEIVESGGTAAYHIKKREGQVSYKIVVSPDGTVLRVVREHRAEVEIPLP